MPTHTRALAVAAAVSLLACAEEPMTYEDITGTYNGPLADSTQGVALSANFSVTIQQRHGGLSGSWSFEGTLNDGVNVLNINGTGSLTGHIQEGDNPTVYITIRNECQGYTAEFTGGFDGTLTIGGPIDIHDNCFVFLTYWSMIILSR
jgi:hypothetical protein